MEDKKLNEQESLELIARMIRNSKRNVRENAGGPALIWGYATVLTSLLVYAGWMLTHQYYSMYGWFLIPVFGGIGTFLFGRHEKPVLIKTYLDRVIFENGNLSLPSASIQIAKLSALKRISRKCKNVRNVLKSLS